VIAAAVMILFFQSVPDQTSTPAAGPEENDWKEWLHCSFPMKVKGKYDKRLCSYLRHVDTCSFTTARFHREDWSSMNLQSDRQYGEMKERRILTSSRRTLTFFEVPLKKTYAWVNLTLQGTHNGGYTAAADTKYPTRLRIWS
jgi:hypothetical protein